MTGSLLRPSSPPASPPGRRTPRETTRLAAALALAILGPALIVAVAARGLDGPTLTTNLPPGREKAARAMDARLAAAPPGILIVGSSKAETDLDPAAIKGVLGYPRPIVQAEIQASAAPAWYAFLQQRVFAAGYQPDLVIVYGTLAGMLEVASGDWWSRSRADNQQLTDTELLQRKLLGGKVSAQLARARARGSALRTGAIEGVRDLVVGGLFAPAGVGWRASGRRLAEPALEAVFGSDATLRGAGTEHAGPVAEPASGPQMEVGTDPEASLIPDIVALVRSHGAAVVFVRAPLPIGSRHLDMVSPDRERAALLLLDSLGAGWIDLHDQPLPPGAFRDFVHLSGSGRAAASRQLATALRDAKVLEHGALPPPVLPLAFRARREGPAVELGPLGPLTPVPGYGCLWFQAAPALGFLSDEALTTLGLGPVSPVTASLGDTPMRAHRDPDPRACTQSFSHAPDGLFLSPARQLQSPRFTLGLADSLPLSSATGVPTWWVYPGSSLTFSFDSAWEPGPWMARVRARILGSGGATLEAGGSRVGLLPAGRVHMASIVGPAPTGPWELTLHAEPGAWVVVDALAVGGAPAVDLIGAPSQPIDLLTASIPIWADRALPDPLPAFVGPEATRTRLGRVCDPVVAGVAAPAPAAGGARPALARKSCDRLGVWLLPDDRARFPVGDEFSDQLRLGADVLRLAGRAFGAEPAGTTAVRVVVRERFNGGPGAVLATGIARFPNAGPTTSVDVALDPPLPPRRRVHVDLEGSPDGGYLLLEGAQLLESESLLPGGGGP